MPLRPERHIMAAPKPPCIWPLTVHLHPRARGQPRHRRRPPPRPRHRLRLRLVLGLGLVPGLRLRLRLVPRHRLRLRLRLVPGLPPRVRPLVPPQQPQHRREAMVAALQRTTIKTISPRQRTHPVRHAQAGYAG